MEIIVLTVVIGFIITVIKTILAGSNKSETICIKHPSNKHYIFKKD